VDIIDIRGDVEKKIIPCLFEELKPVPRLSSPYLGKYKACSPFYMVLAASAEFCLHAGNIEFNTQNEE
jgi:hypothetical protein